MSRIAWGETGKKTFQTGVDQGVLYPNGSEGVPWNGLVSIEESVSGGETEAYYYDGIKYFDSVANEDFKATLSAYTYPDEFSESEGDQNMVGGLYVGRQPRQTFGLSWRTKIGNDVDGVDHGYRLHLLYNATATPSSKSVQTLGDSPEASNFQWEINAVPILPGMDLNDPNSDPGNWVWPEGFGAFGWPTGSDGVTFVKGWKGTAYIWVDSNKVDPATLSDLEGRLHGGLHTPAYLPNQFDSLAILAGADVPYNYNFEWTDPNAPTGPTIHRVQAQTFTDGAPGILWTPPEDPYGGSYEAYIDPVATDSPVPQAGNGQLFFPPYENQQGADSQFLWTSYYGYASDNYLESSMVCGLEATFKTAMNQYAEDGHLDVHIEFGERWIDLEIHKNSIYSLAVSPTGPSFGDYPLPYMSGIDTSNWFTIKLLPTGKWEFGYAGASTPLISGDLGSPPPVYSGRPHQYRGKFQLFNYPSSGVYFNTTPATEVRNLPAMWVKDLYFWIDG